MTVQIERMSRQQIGKLISDEAGDRLSEDELKRFRQCLMSTAVIWVGMVDGKFICTWGLIPPTLLSDQAYLWLYVTEAVHDYEFLFVRNSQRAVEQMLEQYPTIIGHAQVGADRSIRWLKWLGAKFSEPVGQLVPFVIRKK